jgi:probable phosphoglycerate mutase
VTTTRLYLIRHGQSWGNAEHMMVGMTTDRGLSELGRTQAARLRDRLAATGELAADVLIASSLPRARETAEIIAPALGLPVLLDDEVHELRSGEGEGLGFDEHQARYGDWPGRAATQPVDPGGESWTEFSERVTDALERITAQHAGRSVVVVCHGGVIDASLVHFFGLDRTALPPVRIRAHNTSITEWELTDHDPGRWGLVRYNDDVHVLDIGGAERIRWAAARPPHARADDEPTSPLPTEAPEQGDGRATVSA